MNPSTAPLPVDAIEILRSALPQLDDAGLKESVVRAMGTAKQPFDGRPLVTCFQQTNDEGLKFAILNTIALATPYSIDDGLARIRNTTQGETLRNRSIQE